MKTIKWSTIFRRAANEVLVATREQAIAYGIRSDLRFESYSCHAVKHVVAKVIGAPNWWGQHMSQYDDDCHWIFKVLGVPGIVSGWTTTDGDYWVYHNHENMQAERWAWLMFAADRLEELDLRLEYEKVS
jgi:hypothetical protein